MENKYRDPSLLSLLKSISYPWVVLPASRSLPFTFLTGYRKAPFGSLTSPSSSHVGAEGVSLRSSFHKPHSQNPQHLPLPSAPAWAPGPGCQAGEMDEMNREGGWRLFSCAASAQSSFGNFCCLLVFTVRSPFLEKSAWEWIWKIYSLSVRKSKLQIGQSKLPRDLNKWLFFLSGLSHIARVREFGQKNK